MKHPIEPIKISMPQILKQSIYLVYTVKRVKEYMCDSLYKSWGPHIYKLSSNCAPVEQGKQNFALEEQDNFAIKSHCDYGIRARSCTKQYFTCTTNGGWQHNLTMPPPPSFCGHSKKQRDLTFNQSHDRITKDS